ncbi:MAG: very short patch repair endonuclease [Bacillota bacterium]|nr:very short patch repair endonuclease [Bacillota bacterium]
MTDVFDAAKRSEIMSKIHSKNTKPEIALRKALYHAGLRGYRIYYKLPGKPDMAYIKAKVAIFVDGCFWHGCPVCNRYRTNEKDEFWRNKIARNKERDKQIDAKLTELGWTVIRIWEHDIKKHLEDCVRRIRKAVEDKLYRRNENHNDTSFK